MKLTKYVFLFDAAVEFVSSRYDLPKLTWSQLFVLYSVYYLPVSTHGKIVRHAKDMKHPISQPSVSVCLGQLVRLGLIESDVGRYSLSPLGRELLSGVRRYLLNRRLS